MNRGCQEGEGSCRHNWECQGSLVCLPSSLPYLSCQEQCSTSQPCQVSLPPGSPTPSLQTGQGPCRSNGECQPGMTCSLSCLDRTQFPVATFPNNSITMGLGEGDKCCYRLGQGSHNMLQARSGITQHATG